MTASQPFFLLKSKARDLWQNPLLPFHMGLQALLSGSAMVGLLSLFTGVATLFQASLWTLGGSSLVHLLVVWSEISLPAVSSCPFSRKTHDEGTV
ncbi:MAG: hypothetical protein R2865_08400 [Deinococcales bacterium]